MAVVQSDNRFDWCDELLEVKENYNFNECCNIVKNSLKEFKGADGNFLKEVCARANSTFSVRRTFFPVYSVNATVTYDWDVESTQDKGDYTVTTTTHHTNKNTFNKDFYRNIYDACKPNTYVGRNDGRFYRLSHVNDLDGNIYNSGCVYSQSGLENAIGTYASNGKPSGNAEYLVNRWSVTVCFVPVAIVSYTYNGQTYTSTVNMHNGRGYFEYCVSKKVKEKAEKMRKTSMILRGVSLAVSGLGVVLCASLNVWAMLLALVCFVILCITSAKMKHTKQYFLNEYGAQGENLGASVIGKEITQVVVATVVTAVLLLIF